MTDKPSGEREVKTPEMTMSVKPIERRTALSIYTEQMGEDGIRPEVYVLASDFDRLSAECEEARERIKALEKHLQHIRCASHEGCENRCLCCGEVNEQACIALATPPASSRTSPEGEA